MRVYGGFAGSEESRNERDWASRPTVLSGDVQGDGHRGNNAYHVVVGANESRLDGVVVTLGGSDALDASNANTTTCREGHTGHGTARFGLCRVLFREAELAHGRVAMMGALGYLVQSHFAPIFDMQGAPVIRHLDIVLQTENGQAAGVTLLMADRKSVV